MIQRCSKFWLFTKGSGNSFPTIFCVWFFKKNVFHFVFYLLTKFHCLIAFTSWYIGQYAYCNCLFPRLWRDRFLNQPFFLILQFFKVLQAFWLNSSRGIGWQNKSSTNRTLGKMVAKSVNMCTRGEEGLKTSLEEPLMVALNHFFPMFSFSTPWNYRKTLKFSDHFKGYRKETQRKTG